jgi:hypothetical protein
VPKNPCDGRLVRSWKNTAEVASGGVVAEAYNDAVRDFYLHHEFIPLLDYPRKLCIAMGTRSPEDSAVASRKNLLV